MATIEQLTWVFNTRDGASSQNDKIARSLKNVERAQGLVSKASGGLQKAFSSVAGQFTIGTLAANAAMGAFNFLKKTITETFEKSIFQNRVLSQTEAVLKSTGYEAGISAGMVSRLASEFQKTTNFGDEATQAGQNILLTFRGIGREVFPQATAAMLDMSTAMGIDLKSAALVIGKALQDPILGLTALRRQGVNFSDEEKNVIKALVETGQKAKAQAIILAELNKEFGGSAAAAVKADGGITQLGNAFGDFQEVIGTAIIGSDQFSEIISEMKAAISDPEFQESVVSTVKGIMSVMLGLGNAIKTAGDGIIWFFDEAGTAARNTPLLNTIMMIKDSLEGLIGLMGGAWAEMENLQTGQIVNQANQLRDVTTKFRDMRDAVGLTGDELKKIRADFQNIEDPGIRMNKMMQAIRDGKYDTDARKLSVAYKEWNEKLKESRVKVADVKTGVSAAAGEYSKFLTGLGLVTEEGTKKLNEETGFLTTALVGNSRAVEENWEKLEANKKTLETTKKKVDELVGSYEQVPGPLADIASRLKELTFRNFENEQAGQLQIDMEKELNGILEEGDAWLTENIGSTEGLTVESKKLSDYLRTKGLPAFTDYNAILQSMANTIGSVINVLGGLGLISEDTGRKLEGVVNGISGIGSGIDAFKKSGTGITGFLGKITAGFDVLGSAISIVSSIIDLFTGKSGELEAAERRLQGLAGVTADWATKIEELGKKLHGAGADRAFNEFLHEIIGDTEITIDNFDTWIRKVREIVSAYEQGFASIEETSRNFGDAFTAMVLKAKELGLEGGTAMTGLILEAEEFGLQCKAIADYVQNNMTAAAQGWIDVMKTFGNIQMPGLENWVNQSLIMESILPSIRTEIEGVTAALIGQSNATRLNEEQFQLYEDVLADINDKLELQGITGVAAVQANLPMLQRLYFLSQQYGYTLDDETQAMIDLGIQNGLITEQTEDNTQSQIDIENEMLTVLREIRDMFAGPLSDAVDTFTGKVRGNVGNITDDTETWAGTIDDVTDAYGDVTDAIEDMGKVHDDVMTGHSILPDLTGWHNQLGVLESQMDTNMTAAIEAFKNGWYDLAAEFLDLNGDIQDSLDTMYDTYVAITNQLASTEIQRILNDISLDFQGTWLELNEVLGNLANQQIGAGMEVGAFEKYGIITDQMRNEGSLMFKVMTNLWSQYREQILNSKSGMAAFLNDLEKLNVVPEMQGQFEKFIASIRQWNAHVQAGETWNGSIWLPEGWSEEPKFATGTPPGGFIVPPGYPNDSYPIRVTSGELVQVTPPGQIEKFNPGQSVYYYNTNITNYITIYGAEGGDTPQSLADKMIYVVKYNVHGFNNELARKVA